MSLINSINSLKEKMLPVVLLRKIGAEVSYAQLKDDSWQTLSKREVQSLNIRAYIVWVVDSSVSLFKILKFPLNLVAKKDLFEAIQFEVQLFSPWGDDTALYFIPSLNGDEWVVRLWVWQASSERERMHEESDISVGYVVPESIVYVSTIDRENQYLFVQKENGSMDAYQLESNGLPITIVNVSTKQNFNRFMRLSGGQLTVSDVMVVSMNQNDWPVWMELPVNCVKYKPTRIRYDWLEIGRIDGVSPWWGVSYWRQPLAVAFLMLVLFGGGEYLLLAHKNKLNTQSYEQAMVSADRVLLYRDGVLKKRKLIEAYGKAAWLQRALFGLLEDLSKVLPQGVEFRSVRFSNGALILQGVAINAGELPALIEKSELVEKTEFVSAIQTDPQSGMEQFSLRVKLFPEADR